MKNNFNTIKENSFGEFRDRGSKFLAYAAPIEDETEWNLFLESIKKEHPKARHFCYAYRLGLDDNNFRTNDDGEPSGTAGRPILGQIDSFDLTNVGVVVVRYFGGTLLGTSGLINAYKSAAYDAFQKDIIIKKVVFDVYRLKFDYSIMSQVMNGVKKLKLPMIKQSFDANPSLDVGIETENFEFTLLNLKAEIGQIPIEMAAETDKIDGLEIEFVETTYVAVQND